MAATITSVETSGIHGKLASLYENDQKNTYAYPSNLSSERFPHYIVFSIMEPDPYYKPEISTKIRQKYDEANSLNPVRKVDINSEEFKNLNLVEQGVALGQAAAVNAANFAGALTAVVATKDIERKVTKVVALYIPDTVNVSYSSQYEDLSLSRALGTPYFLAQAGASAYDAYKNMTNFNAENIINAIGNNPYARELIGRSLGSIKGLGVEGDSVSKLLNRSIGQALNPQLQVLFQGIDFRRFQFDFTMTPNNAQDAISIKEIIKTFKLASAPEVQSDSAGLFFKVPDKVKVAFYNNGIENQSVHKIGECVIENVTVDYAPMGWSTYKDGAPVQTKLTLQLKEVQIIDKTKINAGY